MRVAVVLGLLASHALANPPDPKSPDGQIMAPFGDWFASQQSPIGGACCSSADGRPVDAKIEGDHWIAHVTPEHWPGVRDQEIVVPNDRIIIGKNPVGSAVLWLSVPHRFSTGSQDCMECAGQDLGVIPGAEVTVLCFAMPVLD